MTFAPNPPRQGAMSPVVRTLLFGVLMIALAAVLWQMSSKSNGKETPGASMSYSDFMNQVDKDNIASARLIESRDTAEIRGQLREPPQSFQVAIPKEVIPSLTDRLRKQGVPIEVSEARQTGWRDVFINIAPILVILAAWISMMIRKRRGSASPPTSPENPVGTVLPTNRPLG